MAPTNGFKLGTFLFALVFMAIAGGWGALQITQAYAVDATDLRKSIVSTVTAVMIVPFVILMLIILFADKIFRRSGETMYWILGGITCGWFFVSLYLMLIFGSGGF
ncbi:MAG: hypothetical protein J7474_08280 [Arthrobacter sp.]|nr:hypothetical protein [Arthrobacter sp.]